MPTSFKLILTLCLFLISLYSFSQSDTDTLAIQRHNARKDNQDPIKVHKDRKYLLKIQSPLDTAIKSLSNTDNNNQKVRLSRNVNQ